MRAASEVLARPQNAGPSSARGKGRTSDLSIDEELALHSIGWEPVQLVCGASIHSVPAGAWNWGQGEITYASNAYAHAFAEAAERTRRECTDAGGRGVVGVHVEVTIQPHHVDVILVGTAVAPVGSKGNKGLSAEPLFLSDLSGRDFALLHNAGWQPVGVAAGASFVYAPRRSAGVAFQQASQNVELTNFTEAMYAARESAMERMQESALEMEGSGVIGVHVDEGPMQFASHAVGFTAFGTVVRPASGHQRSNPLMVLPLDDQAPQFDAASLRGG
jgi:uncharacterized protein YbjQ (UPF0145 family)